ncbi:MAG TPA: hypothetical protein VIH99_01885 [Bdellovibrionota bacterium]|jgi:hypothetical protein
MKKLLFLLFAFGSGAGVAYFLFGQAPTPHYIDGQPVSSTSSSSTPSPTTSPSATTGNSPDAPAASGVPVLSPEKKRILEDLTEEDIETWRKLRSDKIRDFLTSNQEYWHAGYDADKQKQPGRLDLNILKASLGKYECKFSYEIRELKKKSTYKLTLDLNGAEAGAKNSIRMEGGSAGSTNSMNTDFTWQYLGSDGRDLNVVVYNSMMDEAAYASNFAFKLKGGMAIGEKFSTRFMALDQNLHWNELGTAEIQKVR